MSKIIGVAALLALPAIAAAQDVNPGKQAFEARCARCHGGDGSGGPMGPSIVLRLTTRDDAQMATLIRMGIPDAGMPGQPVADAELTALVSFLRTLQRQPGGAAARSFQTVDGRRIDGHVLGEGLEDLQVRTSDQRVHLLRRSGNRVREASAGSDWLSYNGDPRGNRYTTLTQIDQTTVSRLAPQWMFPIPNAQSLQGTPVVAGGIMYVTAPNQVFALDAGSGRQIWRYQRARATVPPASGMANRGVGVAGDRVFLETDNAHVIALNRFTGSLLWETALADVRQNYSASTAPLPVGDLLIAGVSGGEHGANGFVAALSQDTGKEVWRFNTVPKRGEPGSETWQGKDIDHGGAPTWFTGSYDPELDIVYWPVGNPSKEYNGDDRRGDNLYANSLLALDRRSGALKWHYQFTPHDLWDWDATQTSILVDAPWAGQPRKLLLHASRNGFFYVFDRVNGALLLAKPFVRNLTWAKEIDAKGRPVLQPGQEPSAQGTKVCPSQDGATNWFSPSYNPATGLYYLQTFEKCSIYTKSDGGEWEAGKSYLGGVQRTAADPVPQRVLKAIDIRTGEIRWELPQPGPAVSWGGTLSTAAGLVFAGEEGGALIAVDAVTGKTLWSFPTNQNWRASPMTYMFDGKQYLAVIAGATVLAFGIPQTAAQPAFPQAEITNGRIRAVLHLPDPQAGYYRATRFDWSGSIASAEWNGHTYFGQWYARHDPKVNDAITGPVEEWDSIGYEEARPGERFIRLGVGAIVKPDEPAYRRFSTYDIADPGRWTINKSADAIEFVHELGDTRGYAYVYQKTVRLDGNSIVLEHRLKNTGTKPIATNGYNHDFFMLDNQPTGPDFVVKFPFDLTAVSPQAISGVVELRGKEWGYLQEVQRAVQTELTGFGPTAGDYDFRVENRKTGAAVRQTGDRPLTKINVWSPRTAICPEAFIDVRVEPGSETAWQIRYEFYEVPKRTP